MPSLQNKLRVETSLVPSKLQVQVILPIYLCILSGIIWIWPEAWPPCILGLLVTLLFAELWYVWLSHSRNKGKLTLLRSGTLEWLGVWYQYIPLFSCRYCLVLFLRAKGRYLFFPIWKDACSRDDYHRLHLLVRYVSDEKN